MAVAFILARAAGPAGAAPAEPAVAELPATQVAPVSRAGRLIGRYAAVITRVIDGDTVEARVAVWLGQDNLIKVRLRGIDAPELRGACSYERDLARAARDRLQALVDGRIITLAQVGGDKYFGRVVADLLIDDVSVAPILLSEGVARPYGGGRRDGWCAFASR